MQGAMRRKKILEMIQASDKPLSGTAIGQATGVSRQIVVQDIALLRTEGWQILATARGYILEKPRYMRTLVKVCHSAEQTEDELNTIVDLGGQVEDVLVNHHVYGCICAPLHIGNRRDVRHFLADLASGRSTPLSNVTSGYHFHHIAADKQEILDEIEQALRAKGYLQQLQPYERDL